RGADASIEARDLTRVSATGGTARLSFKDGGQAASVTTSGGSAYLSAEPGKGIGVSTDPSLGPVDIVAGAGAVAIDSRGADTIHLGSGPATVTLRGSGSETWAGSGPLVMHGWDPAGGNFTLHGGDGSIMLDQGRSTMRFIGGAGAATLTGGKMDIIAGSGDLVVGGAQVRSFQGGTGRAELFLNNEGSNITFGGGTTVVHATGSWAANVFELGNSKGGVGIIDNFRPGTDRAILGGAAIATQEVRGGSAHVVLTNGVDVTFRGVTDLGRLFG
ncbi:MAG: hypothetical protein H7Z10_07485, partial [Gemmatimonadaceae bacterium]|nr:hypothetical protein [Acetobacteraceae bacterium]